MQKTFNLSLLFGILIFSNSAIASLETTQQLFGELHKLNQEHSTGIFIADPDNSTTDSIKHYLPSNKMSSGCDKHPMVELVGCDHKKICYPDLEFIKINPTKYRIIIKHACQNFTLIFSERFDPMWKAYIIKTKELSEKEKREFQQVNLELMSNSVTHKNVSNGSLEKQQLSESLMWQTWLSGELKLDAHNNDMIAKSGDNKIKKANTWHYFESFNNASFKWPDLLHWEANAFANSWMFDLQGIQSLPQTISNDGFYTANSDGSFNFEVVIEYWPQRLYYLAYFISALTILFCVYVVVFLNPKSITTRILND